MASLTEAPWRKEAPGGKFSLAPTGPSAKRPTSNDPNLVSPVGPTIRTNYKRDLGAKIIRSSDQNYSGFPLLHLSKTSNPPAFTKWNDNIRMLWVPSRFHQPLGSHSQSWMHRACSPLPAAAQTHPLPSCRLRCRDFDRCFADLVWKVPNLESVRPMSKIVEVPSIASNIIQSPASKKVQSCQRPAQLGRREFARTAEVVSFGCGLDRCSVPWCRTMAAMAPQISVVRLSSE